MSNGFLLFFVQNREWYGDSFFFGNSFAIFGLIAIYIARKMYNLNIFLFLFISTVLLLTTSRLSLFGLLFLILNFSKKNIYKYRLLTVLFSLCGITYFFLKFDISSIKGLELFTDRLEYNDDREGLALIAKNLFLKNPYLGNGPIFIEKYTGLEPHLHNIWFDITIGYGIFSLATYMYLFTKKCIIYIYNTKDFYFVLFLILASITQISLKAPFIGILLFSYLNLFTYKKPQINFR